MIFPEDVSCRLHWTILEGRCYVKKNDGAPFLAIAICLRMVYNIAVIWS